MSDNKLLAENTIRRFMKLANTETLTDNFLAEEEKYTRAEMEARAKKAREAAKEKGEKGSVAGKGVASMVKEEEVEETNEEVVNEEETAELEENVEELEEQEEEEMEMDVEMGEEPAEDEPEMEEPMDAPEMDAEPEMGDADMSLSEEEAQLLIDLGQRLAAAIGGAAEEPAEEPELDMEPEMDEEPAEEPEMEEEEEEPAYRVDEEALVNEVLKRVTKRLVAEKLKNRK